MFSFNHNLVHNTESRNIEKIYVTRKNLYNEIKGEIENKKYEEVKFSKSWISNRWLALLADCGISGILYSIYPPLGMFAAGLTIFGLFADKIFSASDKIFSNINKLFSSSS
jgi:hypothetical protein